MPSERFLEHFLRFGWSTICMCVPCTISVESDSRSGSSVNMRLASLVLCNIECLIGAVAGRFSGRHGN